MKYAIFIIPRFHWSFWNNDFSEKVIHSQKRASFLCRFFPIIHSISPISVLTLNLVYSLSYFRNEYTSYMEKIKVYSRNLVKKTTKFRLEEPVLTTDTASNCCVFWVFLNKSEAIFRKSFHRKFWVCCLNRCFWMVGKSKKMANEDGRLHFTQNRRFSSLPRRNAMKLGHLYQTPEKPCLLIHRSLVRRWMKSLISFAYEVAAYRRGDVFLFTAHLRCLHGGVDALIFIFAMPY